MKREAGLWIDHREAVIVFLTDEGEEIKHLASNVEKHIRYPGSSHPQTHGGYDESDEDIKDRRFNDHINKFYDEVINVLHDMAFFLILGPGEAKIEFQKRLESNKADGRVVILESSDRLTDAQLVAQVKHHFRG